MTRRAGSMLDAGLNFTVHIGPIARVGPNDLITASPELIMRINAVRSPYRRTGWFYRATRHRGDRDHVFSQMDEEKHVDLRQRMTSGYSGKENVDLERSIDVHIAEFVQLFRSTYISTDALAKPVDFSKKVQYLTLDVISDISWGRPFGHLRADRDVDDIARSSEEGMWFFNIVLATGLYRLLHHPLIARYVGISIKDATGFGRLLRNARDIIRDRLQRDPANDKRSDMIGSFFRHGLSEDQILSETTLQMVAGADTTASVISVILLYLMTHPRVYGKLQSEIDDAFLITNTNSADGEVISDADARKLPYLQAVIKESMRIHCPVTNASPKRVPDGGDTVVVDGRSVFLPGGTNILYSVWTHRLDRATFGDDAASFRPERWLQEQDEEKLANMHRAHELGFSYGRYQCMGKFIATMEIGKAVFEMMRNFDWSLARPGQPWTEGSFGGLLAHKDMWVLVSERQQSSRVQ
ncbi:cytochrome P450 monooxygenase [Apiospora sp. TS-2023a]